MKMKRIHLPINELAEGELQEKIDYELKRLFDNIHDEKTEAKDPRSLTISFKFTPDAERKQVIMETKLTTKLANVRGVVTSVMTGRSERTGRIQAREMKTHLPGQMYFNENDEVMADADESEHLN